MKTVYFNSKLYCDRDWARVETVVQGRDGIWVYIPTGFGNKPKEIFYPWAQIQRIES